jgi:hypothetical protein
LDAAEHELLRSDSDTITLGELVHSANGPAGDLQTVPAPQILDRGVLATNDDPRVLARNQRVLEREVARGAPTEERLPLGKVDLLEQEAQAEADQWKLVGKV